MGINCIVTYLLSTFAIAFASKAELLTVFGVADITVLRYGKVGLVYFFSVCSGCRITFGFMGSIV